jgi:death-on-curing protein
VSGLYFLTANEVIKIHDLLINHTGGSAGIRDKNLLESAVAQPQAFAFGNYLHPDVFNMAAAYCFHIIKNHSFVDGNKRTGLLTAMTFLEKNGVILVVDMDAFYKLAIDTATSKISKGEIALFFKSCSI